MKIKLYEDELQVGDRVTAILRDGAEAYEVERWTPADSQGTSIPGVTGPPREPPPDMVKKVWTNL